MEWGNPRLRQRALAKRKLGRDMDSHKEPMNAVYGASSGFAWSRPAFAQAVNLPKVANFFFVLFLFGKEKGHRQTRFARRNRRKTEHGICKPMNEGKDDGVGETEAPSARPREAKARTRYGFPQRTDERSRRWQHRKRSFIGLCVTRPAFARAVNLPKVANFFFVLFLFGKEKGQI